ncbi:hypothetical protein TraAM80_02756 [Trypanosoma rangeli]|uniref:Cyclic nucleotide-binding domain-containing protein n=1 Tax=Trypanosoma rangeli TaxID=5698 RepID=A0A422NSL3_TRYRA|nr:uncharacterized protein TraAM80_02756 [Trypanosoma rangeli]RNF08453.1 hypothetical protein TraAM80_02756 [Trypanosoma rangeli]|eukprot:RNF08453.1 hypothetical protein TraAM80_02756 [Trypanosoma rangeli]
MSILDALTSLERRFLYEALERADAKLSLEDVKEERLCGQEKNQSEESSQHLTMPLVEGKNTKIVPSDAVERCSQHIRHENALWDEVERSLEFPFVYRSDRNKDLCLTMLRRIPQFESFLEEDLVVIATQMEIVRVRANVPLAGSMPFPPCCACLSKQAMASASSFPFNEVECLAPLSVSIFGDTEKVMCEHVPSTSRGVNRHVFVLLRGKIALRMPSIKTSVDPFVEPYEVFGLPMTVAALPEGSWYVAAGECMLLCLARDTELAVDRLIANLEKQLLKEQVLFLQRQLRVKVFTHWTAEKYEAVARMLVPLRASWRQMVVTQGMEADALYFIKEGQCVVVRDIPVLHQQQQKREGGPKQLPASTYAEDYSWPQRIPIWAFQR